MLENQIQHEEIRQQQTTAEIKLVRKLKHIKPKNQPFLGFTFLDKKRCDRKLSHLFYWQELPEIAFGLLFSHA